VLKIAVGVLSRRYRESEIQIFQKSRFLSKGHLPGQKQTQNQNTKKTQNKKKKEKKEKKTTKTTNKQKQHRWVFSGRDRETH